MHVRKCTHAHAYVHTSYARVRTPGAAREATSPASAPASLRFLTAASASSPNLGHVDVKYLPSFLPSVVVSPFFPRFLLALPFFFFSFLGLTFCSAFFPLPSFFPSFSPFIHLLPQLFFLNLSLSLPPFSPAHFIHFLLPSFLPSLFTSCDYISCW